MKKTLLCTILALTASLNAAECHWQAISGKWSNPASWENQKVPGPEDVAIFSGKKINEVIIDKKVKIKSLKIAKNCFAKIYQKANVTLAEDFILMNGTWYAGKQTISCGKNFLTEGRTFNRGYSTVILTGDGQLKGTFFNKLIMAFPDKKTELISAIYPFEIEVRGGTLTGKSGIKFYSDKPSLTGLEKSLIDIVYIAFRPGKDCMIKIPKMTLNGKLYLDAYNAKAVFLVEGDLIVKKGISVKGNNGGIAILELDGGLIQTPNIKVGNSKGSAGQLRLFSGKAILSDGIFILNKQSSLIHTENFKLPKIKINKGSVTIE
jgi:hypothetical protein